MLWLPNQSLASNQHNLAATPATVPGTTLTGGTANTKGSWQSLIDPVDFDASLLCLSFYNSFTAATRTDQLVDIGIGPTGGGSEQVILPNLLAGWAGLAVTNPVSPRHVVLPVHVPRGARLSARNQGVIASDTVSVHAHLFSGQRGSMATFKGADAYGVTSSGASVGTTITPGATAGTEGSWTNVGSTTSRPYDGLLLMVQGTLADTVTTNIAYHFEIGYSSTTLMEYFVATSTNETSYTWPPVPYFGPIPTGTQLQVRAEQSGTDNQTFDVALYGLY